MPLTKKKSNIALDIGSYALKVMEVSTAQKAPIIENIGVYELQGSSEEGLSNGLKSLLDTTNISAKEVNISIAGSAVVVRFIELPLMQDSELSQALPYEAEKYLPFDIKDVILDHVVLDKNQKGRKIKVLLVGAKKDFVRGRVSLLKERGLAPNVIDVDSFAIFNVFVKSIPQREREKKTIVLLDIGDQLTNVVVVYGENPWMVRDINIGGANMTQALQEQFGVDAATARNLKHNPAGRAEEVFTVLKGILQRLADEIKLSFTYYENQYGRGVDEVYISGGSINLKGAVSILEESVGLKFKQWDPLRPFEINPKISEQTLNKFRSSLAVCSGLALRN